MIQTDVFLVTLRVLQSTAYPGSQALLPPGPWAKGHWDGCLNGGLEWDKDTEFDGFPKAGPSVKWLENLCFELALFSLPTAPCGEYPPVHLQNHYPSCNLAQDAWGGIIRTGVNLQWVGWGEVRWELLRLLYKQQMAQVQLDTPMSNYQKTEGHLEKQQQRFV